MTPRTNAKLLKNGLCFNLPVDLKPNAMATEHPDSYDDGTGNHQPQMGIVVDREHCANRT